ncbi:Ig-like domain-containing protein [Pseudochryseolinea flava]|uniref:Uncharacterized protein n=1 Tax=Pseudochryseolinea flava TaxID=2059302 RepID=A0A364XVX4_9BACT|nr:Ig-like domain-containing protein [Pseudochryseolinea flava]RAV98085.1 hypothetical protein DQQ10_25465 [Pseudochryseolinea flava]
MYFLNCSRKLAVLFIILAVVLQGCGDDTPEQSKTPAIVLAETTKHIFSGSSAKLSFTVSAGESIETVSVYVDDQMIDNHAFNGDKFYEVIWNTKTVEDGVHKVTVKLTDKSGNVSEETFEVTVRNVLLKVIVKPHAMSTGSRAIMFISDNNGNPMVTRELVNGTEVIFENEVGYQEETFLLSVFYRGEFEMTIQLLDTFTDFRPATISYGDDLQAEETEGQAVPLTISNLPFLSNEFVINGAFIKRFQKSANGDSELKTELVFTQSKSDLFVLNTDWVNGNAYLFKETLNVSEGQFKLNYDDFLAIEKVKLTTPGGTNYFNSTNGYRRIGGKPYSYFLGFYKTQENDTLLLPQMSEGVFDYFESNTSFTIEGVRYESSIIREELPTSILLLDASITSHDFSDGNLTVNTQGSCDLLMFRGDRITTIDGKPFQYGTLLLTGHEGTVAARHPKLPEYITSQFDHVDPVAIGVQSVTMTDYEDFSSYDAFLNNLVTGESLPHYSRLQKVYDFEASNGRLPYKIDKSETYSGLFHHLRH